MLPSFPPLLLVVVAATEDPGLAVAGGHELCSAAIATARAALALGGGKNNEVSYPLKYQGI